MIVGTAGHIDHGKTALVRTLTGVDTDRLKEEKARGISIDLGFAYLPGPDGALGFVDAPGHEKFVRNMLAGATGVDFVLLVVAADDGPMPQTIEHLAILDLLGVRSGVVALTKVDLVSPARRAQVAQEVAGMLAATGLAAAEIIAVSTVTGEGVDRLRDKLLAAAAGIETRKATGRFRLAVDRCFTLAGVGTVVTGTVLSGMIAVGDKVMVSPSGLAARVRSIHAQNRPAERGLAGERCALNLVGEGVAKHAVARGDMVLEPGLHAPAERIDATLRVLSTEQKPLGQWTPVRLHLAAAEIGARIALLGDAPIAPGDAGLVQLVLERPIAAAVGDRFILRDTSARRTIGGGRFLDLRAPARRRRTPERLAQLDAHAIAEPDGALRALLERAPFYVDLAAFARDRALAAAEVERAAAALDVAPALAKGAPFALSSTSWARLRESVRAELGRFHADSPDARGIALERLRVRTEPRLPPNVFSSVLQALARQGEVVIDGAAARLPGHELKLAGPDERLWSRIAPLLSGVERFRPPRLRELAALLSAPESEVRRLLKTLARMGRVTEVAPDHFYLGAALCEIVDIAAALAAEAKDRQFSAAQLRDRLDNGRKAAIEILEYLDRHGVTLRRGDLRRMNAQKLDLFRRQAEGAPSATGPTAKARAG